MSKDQAKPATQITEYRPRLPYHPALKDKIGIGSGEWNVLVDTVFPAAKTAGAVALAVSYCKARKLDIFKRVVHIVPIWDKDRGCMVETVWPGIAEHRTTAARTREYAGHDEVVFGPEVTMHFQDGERTVTVTFPQWAQMTVYRLVQGNRCPFPGPRVRWLETYAAKKTDAPNQMWADRPFGMIEKCCEAAALRSAFPEELGDEPSEVEASGRNWHGRPAVDVTPLTTATISRSEAVIPQDRQVGHTTPSKPQENAQEAQDDVIDPSFEVLPDKEEKASEIERETAPMAEPNAPGGQQSAEITDDDRLEGLKYALEVVTTPGECSDMRRNDLPKFPKHLQAKARKMILDRQNELDRP